MAVQLDELVWEQEVRGPLQVEHAFPQAVPQQIATQGQARLAPQQAAEAVGSAVVSVSPLQAERLQVSPQPAALPDALAAERQPLPSSA